MQPLFIMQCITIKLLKFPYFNRIFVAHSADILYNANGVKVDVYTVYCLQKENQQRKEDHYEKISVPSNRSYDAYRTRDQFC